MGARRPSTAAQEQREIEWIRAHPETALTYVRERKELRKELELVWRSNAELRRNLERADQLHEALNTRVQALEAENADLQSQLDFCRRKLGG